MDEAETVRNCVNTLLFGEVCDSCSGSSIYIILAQTITIATFVIGALAVIGIIICGITYLTSGGDVARQTKAKSRLVQILIGILCYGMLYAIGSFLIPGDFFTGSEEGTCPAKHKNLERPKQNDPGGSDGGNGGGNNGGNGGNGGNKKDAIDIDISMKATGCPTINSTADSRKTYREGDWFYVNTKLKPTEYAEFLKKNNIKQNGPVCQPNGVCSKIWRDSDAMSDSGDCLSYATVFAANMYFGQCVSNDYYATKYENGHNLLANDNGVVTSPEGNKTPIFEAIQKAILKGRPSIVKVGTSGNGRHFVTAVAIRWNKLLADPSTLTEKDFLMLDSVYGLTNERTLYAQPTGNLGNVYWVRPIIDSDH